MILKITIHKKKRKKMKSKHRNIVQQDSDITVYKETQHTYICTGTYSMRNAN